jgi:hypothetical protein
VDGWHRLEKDPWPARAKGYEPLSKAQRTTYADDLMRNTTLLHERVEDLSHTVDQIANGARGLLDEVATGKVTGEEEYWSRTDLWETDAKAGWLAGGSYLVARRINMTIEIWDRQPLREQERVIGRTKAEGAPLSGGGEFSQPDFTTNGREHEPLVATDAHVRMVHPSSNGGVRMLRRGYNFVDGSNGLSRMDAGLFFLAFVRDPRTHFCSPDFA